MAEDGIDPEMVPKRTLYTGAQIPAIGLGTFGSDRFSGESIAAAVLGAAEVGYRHFDCAAVYGNEHLIGESLQAIMGGGVP
ncbi:MAG: aldo/keto reductase, partial [Firmicutes bacterium]|nr:aldo/keto reductase [Bacillota bacterium]